MVDLPILYFRNPLHDIFLEMYYLHCLIAFSARSGIMSLYMCMK